MSRRPNRRRANSQAVSKASFNATTPTILDAVSDGSGNAGPRPTEMETYYLLYSKHPWVSTCVSLIAEAVAAETFVVTPVEGTRAQPRSDQDDERVGMLHQFFANATPDSTFASLRLATAIDMKVHGLAYWRKKRASKKGLPLYLERLDPRRMSAKLNANRTAIASFTLRHMQNNGALDGSNGEALDPKDVIFFRMVGGDPIFGAPSPLEALDLTIAQDWSIRRHREAFFRNGGVTGRLIQIAGVNEETARVITKRLKADKVGVDAAFKDLVLPGEGITVHESGATQGKNDFDFAKGSAALRDEIFAVFKVPPGKIFLNTGLGSAGKQSDDDSFQRDAVLPVERVMYETITRDLLGQEFGIHDLRLVPARMDHLRLDMFPAAKSMLEAGGTGNEARLLMGLPSVEKGEIDLDVPLFLGSNQPVAATKPATAATGSGSGDVTELGDQITGGK